MLAGRLTAARKRGVSFSNPLAGNTHHHPTFLEVDIKVNTNFSEDLPTPHKTVTSTHQRACSVLLPHSPLSQQGALSAPDRKTALLGPARPHHTKTVSVRQASTKLSYPSHNVRSATADLLVHAGEGEKPRVRRRSLRRKMAINPYIGPFVAPYIHIRILDKIQQPLDIEQQSIQVNFDKIFRKLIRSQLMGDFTGNFMSQVEHYVRTIVESGEIYENPWNIQLQQSLKSLSRKDDLLDAITDLQLAGEDAKVLQLVKYYCIPPQRASKAIFEELLSDLTIEIYEKKSCRRDISYTLLREDGQQITHISQIYFSTLTLLIAQQEHASKVYQQYSRVIFEKERSLRLTLRQSIRQNFMEKVVENRVEKAEINYTANPHHYLTARRAFLQQAEFRLQRKSKLRLQIKRDKPEGVSIGLKLLSGEGMSQEEWHENMLYQYALRRRKERREYKQILNRLQQILDPSRKIGVRSRLDERTEEQFRVLHHKNDKYDITYNHSPDNSNKLFLLNLMQNSPIFSTKTSKQLQSLTRMMREVYGKGEAMSEVHFWQFKEIYEAAHGLADKEVIMKLVLSYLCFNQYGQLPKSDFLDMMQVCMSGSGRSLRVVEEVLWGWLEGEGLVVNGALKKEGLCCWYQPVRVVFLLLLSIIFGTQYGSVEEMLLEMVKYEYY